MRIFLYILTITFTLFLQGCGEEQKPKPVVKVDENIHPRLSDPNPSAWEGLSMELVIADFQQSDGIFSSFICDEINKRLSVEPSGTLKELSTIDKKSRSYAFKICLSPEGEDPSGVLKAISKYSGEYPDLVKEIIGATK
jgi:hypothetical protein